MKNNTGKTILILIGSLILLAGTFSGGVLVGWALPDKTPANADSSPQSTTGNPSSAETTPITVEGADKDQLFEPFWQAWDIVHDQYLEQPVDDTLLMQGAISGMLDSLGDPYTSYMDPIEYEEQQQPLNGEYEGIGVYVDTSGDTLVIISPIPDTPAEAAGLKSGDQIIGVNGEDVTGIDGSLVIRRILGPEGTSVRITIKREGMDPFEVEIMRAKIDIPSVAGKMLENNIAYIELATFGEETPDELHTALEELLANDPVGLILDLRYNGGGYLDTAIAVVSEFIPGNKIVVYEEFGDGARNEIKSSSNGIARDIPLIILVNEGSASASEITAGAIQDYDRGLLVGTTTFGKGLVQSWIPLENDQGAMRVTVARWLTPNGNQVQETGLKPDYVVEYTEEDYNNDVDPQLEKAIEVLLSQVK
ncbi:MAG: S41 family peptidase [Chloroflexi bacterium]|nr:S41 family peptidase [Chloroflexota bacterium]